MLNKLHINMTKCCYIHFKPKGFTSPDTSADSNLQIDDFVIKKTKETKFLGVIIDEKLSWEAHVTPGTLLYPLRIPLIILHISLGWSCSMPNNTSMDCSKTMYKSSVWKHGSIPRQIQDMCQMQAFWNPDLRRNIF